MEDRKTQDEKRRQNQVYGWAEGRGLMLLFPQNVLFVAGCSLLFVALANWACLCFVQRCNETTQFI